jgi:hypothetical protein
MRTPGNIPRLSAQEASRVDKLTCSLLVCRALTCVWTSCGVAHLSLTHHTLTNMHPPCCPAEACLLACSWAAVARATCDDGADSGQFSGAQDANCSRACIAASALKSTPVCDASAAALLALQLSSLCRHLLNHMVTGFQKIAACSPGSRADSTPPIQRRRQFRGHGTASGWQIPTSLHPPDAVAPPSLGGKKLFGGFRSFGEPHFNSPLACRVQR